MAAAVQTHIQKVEETLKGYLYEGPLTPLWSLAEQKTKLKRERIALGRPCLLLPSFSNRCAFSDKASLVSLPSIWYSVGRRILSVTSLDLSILPMLREYRQGCEHENSRRLDPS
jgi:hypothetical protein